MSHDSQTMMEETRTEGGGTTSTNNELFPSTHMLVESTSLEDLKSPLRGSARLKVVKMYYRYYSIHE